MNPLRDTGHVWWRQDIAAMVVTILTSQGSTPREVGTRMLVSATTQAGTIGGGNLEWQACAQARRLIANVHDGLHSGSFQFGSFDCEAPPALEQRIALGPSLGQCCGGIVWLRFERLSASTLAAWPDQAALFHLHLFGAGHVGSALVRTLVPLACTITWYDNRAQYAQMARQQAERGSAGAAVARVNVIECDEAGGAFAERIAANELVLVMTHRHDFDLAICTDVLRENRFGFLGLIGSKTKRARFARRLAQSGLSDATIARLHCPLAAAATSSKEPAALAIVIAAQLLQVIAAQAAAQSRSSAYADTVDALA